MDRAPRERAREARRARRHVRFPAGAFDDDAARGRVSENRREDARAFSEGAAIDRRKIDGRARRLADCCKVHASDFAPRLLRLSASPTEEAGKTPRRAFARRETADALPPRHARSVRDAARDACTMQETRREARP